MTDNNQAAINPVTQAATLAKSPISSSDDVHRLTGALGRIMDALDEVLTEETSLLRDGKLAPALDLVEAKNQLSIQYMLLQKAIVQNAQLVKQLAPEEGEALTLRHQQFQTTLQTNLAVIATAREVSNEMVDTINKEVQKGAKAQIYSQSGYMPNQVTQHRGIAIDTAS